MRTVSGWRGDAASRRRAGRAVHNSLLLAAVAAVVVYVLGDVVAGLRDPGYSYRDQAISELSAFGIGLLRGAGRRSAWWIGALQVAMFVLVGIPTHTFWAMSSRDTATGFNDTMHATSSVVFSLLVVAMMILSGGRLPRMVPLLLRRDDRRGRRPRQRRPRSRCAGSR